MNRLEYMQKRKELSSQKPKLKFGDKPTKEQKEKNSFITEKTKELVNEYIEQTKPCSIDDTVEIVLHSGRKVKGVVTDLGILHDGKVHPTAYKVGNKVRYISSPIQSLKVI